jgi:hypothetical protein
MATSVIPCTVNLDLFKIILPIDHDQSSPAYWSARRFKTGISALSTPCSEPNHHCKRNVGIPNQPGVALGRFGEHFNPAYLLLNAPG